MAWTDAARAAAAATRKAHATATVSLDAVRHTLRQHTLAKKYGISTKSGVMFGSTGKSAAGPGLAKPGKKLHGKTAKALGGFKLK